MNKNSIFLSICFVFLYSISYSQTYIKTAEFSPHNPTTTEMVKQSLTPVNKYVGKANVSVPLYSMNFDGITIPFNLSYDTGGIKVSQESSWIGLGWNLSGVPTITHIVNQESDIGSRRPNNPSLGFTPTGYCFEPAIPAHHSGFDYQQLASGPDYTLYSSYDTQPDVFIATLYSSTVIFQLTQKSQTSGIIEARILNESNAKINFIESSRTFVIIDENGFEYHFNHIEYSSHLGISDSLFGAGELEPENIYFEDNSTSFNSTYDSYIPKAWYPDKVISPNHKELRFNYYGGEGESREKYLHLSMPIFQQTKEAFACGIDFNNGTLDGSNLPDPFGGYNATISAVESKIPKEIINMSTGERIIFNISDRLDLKPLHKIFHHPLSLAIEGQYDYNDKPQKLSSLNVFSSSGEIIKNIDFNNDSYFNEQYISDIYPEKNLRLKLDGVSVDGLNYTFDYDNPNGLPKKNSMDVDFWGYFNDAGNQNRFPSITFEDGFCLISNPEYIGNPDINGGMLGSKFSAGKIGTLTQVTYPTKGYTTYEYESNTARVSTSSTSDLYSPYSYSYLLTNNLEAGYPLISTQDPNLKTFKVGGLRIESVTNFDVNHAPQLKKEYNYESTEHSSTAVSTGKLMNKLLFFEFQIEELEGGNIQLTKVQTSSMNKVGVLNSALGSHVGYDEVQEIIKSNSSSSTNGSIVTKYKNNPSSNLIGEDSGFQLETVPYHYDNRNGLVDEEFIYDSLDNPIKHTINNYSIYQNFISRAYKIYYGFQTGNFFGAQISQNPVAEIFSYSTKKYVPLLSSTETINYLSNGEVSTVVNNQYNSKQRIKSTLISLSSNANDEQKVDYFYPYDTDYGLNTYPSMSSLVQENRIAEPTYIRTYRNGQFTGHELQPFNNFNGILHPSGINFQKHDAALLNIEKRVTYDSYDNYGNITQMTQSGGLSTQYLWGYENQQLVAAIRNPNQGPSTAPIDDIVNINLLQNSKLSSSINTELDLLRNHPDYQNAQIQSYVYQSGVGLVQSSDIRGYQMNYTYDNKERLIKVKDNDNALLSVNEYNLLDEVEPCVDCKIISLNTSSYTYSRTENFDLNINLPNNTPSIQKWKVDFGDGTITEGNGSPPSIIGHSYSLDEPYGLKVIRVYANFNDQNFITGNVNVRVAEGTITGEDVRFGDITVVNTPNNTPKKIAKIYGTPGSQVSYKAFIAGATSEQYGYASVIGGGSHNISGSYDIEYGTVTIPASILHYTT